VASEVFDSRLRPAIEFLPAMVLGGGGALLGAAPGPFFPLMPGLATLVAAVFLALAGWRFYQGCQILRYRRQLKRLPRYVLDAEAIPYSRHRLFLGRGFQWDQRHSQRLIEARSPSGRRYVEPGRLYRAVRVFELRFEHTPVLAHLARLTARDARWNLLRPLPPVGGDPALHGVGLEDEEPIWMALGERVGHTLVLGTTRVGKTSGVARG